MLYVGLDCHQRFYMTALLREGRAELGRAELALADLPARRDGLGAPARPWTGAGVRA